MISYNNFGKVTHLSFYYLNSLKGKQFASDIQYSQDRLDPNHPRYPEWKKKNPSSTSFEDIWDAKCYQNLMKSPNLLGIFFC